MEDEERQKKLEAGKAKVIEPGAAGPAVGGGSWEGWVWAWEEVGGGLWKRRLLLPRCTVWEGGAAGSAFSFALFSLCN